MENNRDADTIMISTQNVTKYFGGFQALKDVSFEINKGEIVGFLGQNGAGKTTLMRILTSYLPATSGKVEIGGKDVAENSLAVRRKIGYLPETPPLYSNMSVKDYLRFAAQMKDVPGRQQHKQIDRVLEECNISDVKNKTIDNLSKGYRQRVGIAQAIINEPEVLILDEPTSGLDPIQNLQVRKLIKSLRHERTVIISTHILSEIEQIAQRVLIIRSGQIIVDESLDLLLKGQKGSQCAESTLEDVFIRLHSDPSGGNDE
jgi:ABC-2 type transport system ATP-binding protein